MQQITSILLCPNCPSAATNTQSLYSHCPTALCQLRTGSVYPIPQQCAVIAYCDICLVESFLQYAPDLVVHRV